jgi:mRNA-degrading endonuclease HigB of HigAB toxin-antitoxin module
LFSSVSVDRPSALSRHQAQQAVKQAGQKQRFQQHQNHRLPAHAQAIKAQYRSASVLKNRRVVFNIKGNDYRLIVAIAYKLQIVFVKFVGHKEYDAVDAETVETA